LFAILLVVCCVIGPLLQLVLGISNVNLDGELSLPPYEVPAQIFFPCPSRSSTHTHTHTHTCSLYQANCSRCYPM
jgi:hypothetical protein